jgi:hypothetical protein
MLVRRRRPMRVMRLYSKDEGYRGTLRYARRARDIRVGIRVELEENRLEVWYDCVGICFRGHNVVDN